LYEVRWWGESPDTSADRLIAELSAEFDLLRLKRYMADLERRDARLVEEIDILKAWLQPPTRAPSSQSATSPDTGRLRRWWRVLVTEAKVFWLEARREMLAEEWRRCSAVERDIRFGLLVTGVRKGGTGC